MKTVRNRKNCKRGFTLMEMLIVVAIIAILIAVAIPTMNTQLHKARVAADWANLRAYYAELQTEYMTTGEFRDDIPVHLTRPEQLTIREITFANGQTVKMQAGYYSIVQVNEKSNNAGVVPKYGYQITYQCDLAGQGDHYEKHTLILG